MGAYDPPSTNFGAQLSSIGDTILNNRERARQRSLREAFASGTPRGPDGNVDYGAMAERMYSLGDIATANTLTHLGIKQQELRMGQEGVSNVNKWLGNEQQQRVIPSESGPVQVGAPSARPEPSPIPPPLGDLPAGPNARRQEVMPSKTVWGDREAEAAGLYESPKQVAQAPQASGATSSPPVAGPVGNDSAARQRINRITSLLANPYLPQSTRDALKARLDAEMKSAEPTGEIKNFQTYVAQETSAGRRPLSFNDWMQQGKQTEQEKGFDKQWVDRYKENITSGQKATETLGTLNLLDRAMGDQRFYSGPLADHVLTLKRATAVLGGDPNAAASMESFRALANKSVFSTLGGLGNQISDGDRKFIISAFPTLDNTPTGNKMMVGIMRRLSQRQIEIGQLSQDYLQKNGRLDVGFDRAISQYAEANPLFGPEDMNAIERATGVRGDNRPTGAPSRQDIENEMRRRGLLR